MGELRSETGGTIIRLLLFILRGLFTTHVIIQVQV